MIVLDTHVWVWWVSQSTTLPDAVQDLLKTAMTERAVYVSCISTWELALLVKKRRLVLTLDVADWISHCESLPFLHFVPVSNPIALRSTRLPGALHSDPADRLIVATALSLGAKLVTRDEKLHDYPHVETIW